MSDYQQVSYLLHELEYWKWLLERGYVEDFIKTAKNTLDKVVLEMQA